MIDEMVYLVSENGAGVVSTAIILFTFSLIIKDLISKNNKVQDTQIETLKSIGENQKNIEKDVTTMKYDINLLKEGQKGILQSTLDSDKMLRDLISSVEKSNAANQVMIENNVKTLDKNINMLNQLSHKFDKDMSDSDKK